jgi:hypothetical protein
VTEARGAAPTSGRWRSPFLAFGLAAALAIAGALWEDSYYASTPSLAGASIGTTLGVAAAAVVFFLLAWYAPANE